MARWPTCAGPSTSRRPYTSSCVGRKLGSGKSTPAMWVRDRLNGLFVDADFVDWFPTDGRPGCVRCAVGAGVGVAVR